MSAILGLIIIGSILMVALFLARFVLVLVIWAIALPIGLATIGIDKFKQRGKL